MSLKMDNLAVQYLVLNFVEMVNQDFITILVLCKKLHGINYQLIIVGWLICWVFMLMMKMYQIYLLDKHLLIVVIVV